MYHADVGYYFLKSQADAVIASLWNVSDSSTSQLMQVFYEHALRANPVTKAEALQQPNSHCSAAINQVPSTMTASPKSPKIPTSPAPPQGSPTPTIGHPLFSLAIVCSFSTQKASHRNLEGTFCIPAKLA